MTSLRVMRERQIAASALLDNYEARQDAGGNQALLVRTTTVMTYPTSAQSYYACNPLVATGNETEGGAATLAPDTNTVLYALNLGTSVPPAGTDIVANLSGNRYSFRFGGGGGGGGACCNDAAPCAFPAATLTLSYSLSSGTLTGTVPLVYGGDCTWDTGCVATSANSSLDFTITVVGGVTTYRWRNYTANNACGGSPTLDVSYVLPGGGGGLTLIAYGCEPLSVEVGQGTSNFTIT